MRRMIGFIIFAFPMVVAVALAVIKIINRD